ncbi:FadR family transcriptional regulator [Mumia zhuanghuii]|uniref:FadR/GntR family transcriptional regulator n=2 Tax=Mumia TaxID=1546255 RepID=A0ABW1QSA2_9ACTN|nr:MULTISPECIES: FCD domain-containing protein [Mumia]KAA1424468.1 FadR family transcriptional regulator [Mumia zhuanghuii]
MSTAPSDGFEDGGVEDALLRPVRTGNAFEDTVSRLLQTVRLGVIAPGESLPSERDLALRLGVSRDTVREAIRTLNDAGYVQTRRGRYGGTFVVDDLPERAHHGPAPAPDFDLDDVLRLREILEVGGVRMAAARSLSASERDTLWTRLQELRSADPVDYRRLDSRLHLTLAEMTGSPSLLPLVADVRMKLNVFLDDIPLLPRNIAHSDEQHETIVIAVLTGDSDRAAAAMEEHLAGSASLLRGFLS